MLKDRKGRQRVQSSFLMLESLCLIHASFYHFAASTANQYIYTQQMELSTIYNYTLIGDHNSKSPCIDFTYIPYLVSLMQQVVLQCVLCLALWFLNSYFSLPRLIQCLCFILDCGGFYDSRTQTFTAIQYIREVVYCL